MRYYLLLFSLVLLPALCLNGQTVITGSVTDSLNKPISSASVYLSQTTIGTLTDNDGNYSLTIPGKGIYEMMTSFVGYKSDSQFISADGVKQIINIKLTLNFVKLREITVKSTDKNRLANYTLFVKQFLGETLNSQFCKILNPGDIHFFRDAQNNTLNAFSVKPLLIENKALGYILVFDLADFSYNLETGFMRFKGNHYFQPLKGTTRENKKWEHNRLSAYYGSQMHLFRAIFSDSVLNENYKLFECSTDSASKELNIIKAVSKDEISISKNPNFLAMYSRNPLLIKYTDNHPELETGLTGFQSREVISTIEFSDFINVYRNGYFDNPYAITWGGDMANERIANMLPYDFYPFHKSPADSESDTDLTLTEKYLKSEQLSQSPDQVFIQTDRNMYTSGDTIHFQAYIRNRFTGQFQTKSISLYALLFNDNHIIADSSRFKISKSTASGWLAIPEKEKTGKCHFVAFTGTMQNYDPVDAFQTDLLIKERNIKPVQNKTGINKISNKSVVETQTVSEPKSSDKTSFMYDSTLSETNDHFELRFLPEGGSLVKGLEQRIGFNATGDNGEPISIEGVLKNSSGSILDTIRSGNYGPGLFVCKPQKGMFIELINSNEKDNIRPLPDPDSNDICLSVRPVDKRSFAIEIQSDNYSNQQVTISGVMNSTGIFSKEVVLNKKQRVIIETDQLQSGIAQITLFNKEMKPVAERLYFVNPDKHLRFNINSGSPVHKPGEDTELAISVTDDQGNPASGIFSIAVSDSLSGHEAQIFTPGIEYTFDYKTNLPGGLPSKVLVKGIENMTEEDRDLILMTYGWRRYTWDFAKQKSNTSEVVNYDQLKMKILYALKNHRADRRLDLVSLEGPSVMHLITNNLGEVSLPLDSLPENTRSVTMMPDVKNKKRVLGAMLSIPYNEKYFKSTKLGTSQPAISSDAYETSSSVFRISLPDSVQQIQEVEIKGHPRAEKVYHDKYEENYQYGHVSSLDYNLLWTATSLQDAVLRLVAPYQMTQDYIILNAPHSFIGGSVPALIVVNGNPIYQNGWMWAKTYLPSELTSLTILKGPQANAIYGGMAAGGVIFVNTGSDNPKLMQIRADWKIQHSNDKMLLPIDLYRQKKEFYIPPKKYIDVDPALQTRPTLFWDPEVYFAGNRPVTIKYNNLKHQGPVIITINGVSLNNMVGTGRGSYQVNYSYQ